MVWCGVMWCGVVVSYRRMSLHRVWGGVWHPEYRRTLPVQLGVVTHVVVVQLTNKGIRREKEILLFSGCLLNSV